MDLNDTEFIEVQALGGADNAVVNDVTGTDLKLVAFDLESAIGGGAGDGAADSVTVNGTTVPMTSRSRRAGVPWMSTGCSRPSRSTIPRSQTTS